jgi:uracil-DNA glycosylase family protein
MRRCADVVAHVMAHGMPPAAALPDRERAPHEALEMPRSTKQTSLPFAAQDAAPGTAAPLIPERPTLPRLREAAAGCRACHLWTRGTQTVFGEGRAGASLMLVGEQPGDAEDRAGRPFVGPSGRLLDEALDAAGIDREDTYVTNVVKHFKWEPRGKRRIHSKPVGPEIRACRPWLDAEIALVRPRGIVCLGATAAQALLGRDFRVTARRGELVPTLLAPLVLATVHPSSILRIPDSEERRSAVDRLVADLAVMAAALYRAAA